MFIVFFNFFKNKEKRYDFIVFFLIALIVLFAKWSTIHDPYFWDDLGGVVAPALDMYDHNFRWIHPNHNFGHPQLQQLTLALSWKIFGYSLTVSHLYLLAIAIIGLFYLYKLGSLVANRTVGIGAAVLLFFSQLYFAQSGLLNDAIPLATLSVITVYYYTLNKKTAFIISASALVLTKETGAVVLAAIFIHYFLSEILKQSREQKKISTILLDTLSTSWFILFPLIPLAAWFAYNKQMLGWAIRTDLVGYQAQIIHNMVNNFIYYFVYDFNSNQVNFFNFILTALIITSYIKERKLLPSHALSWLVIILNLFLLAQTDNLPRYFVPLLPFFYLLAAQAIYTLITPKKYSYLVYACSVAILVALNFSVYTGCRDNQCHLLETNMEYRDFIKIRKTAIQTLEVKYHDRQIITQWPMTDILSDPRYGYVQKPFNIIDATVYKRDQYTLGNNNFNKKFLLRKKGALVLYDCKHNDLLAKIITQPNLKTTKWLYNNKSFMISEIY